MENEKEPTPPPGRGIEAPSRISVAFEAANFGEGRIDNLTGSTRNMELVRTRRP